MSSLYLRDREYLLTRGNAEALNSYKYIGDHDIFAEPFDEKAKALGTFGGKISLFNAYNSVLSDCNFREAMNMPLLDIAQIKEKIRKESDCSIRALVEKSMNSQLGSATYDYSDFMYCKHLGKVPNNYMITLRRFSNPVGDHINQNVLPSEISDYDKKNRNMLDLGRMVTWLGVSGNEMSQILTYSYHQDWKEAKSTWNDTTKLNANNQKGPLAGLMNATSSDYQSSMIKGFSSTWGYKDGKQEFGSPAYDPSEFAPWNDRNRPYGKKNIISKTTIMGAMNDQEPEGITFEQDIKLVFEYEMRSYDGINQRAAFMDLLGNILTVTFTEADFWGGGYRSVGPQASSAYTNLSLFKAADQGKLNSWADFIDSGINSLDEIGSAIAGKKDYSFGDLIKGGLNALFANFKAGMLDKLGRPQKQMFQSLFKPQPTCFWHLTIGNPQHPILSIGNLYITNCVVTHSGLLGIDDFPTGLKVEVNLKHGKPRSTREIEMMYLNGDSRVYQPMNTQLFRSYGEAKGTKKTVDRNSNAYAEQMFVDNISSRSPLGSISMHNGIKWLQEKTRRGADAMNKLVVAGGSQNIDTKEYTLSGIISSKSNKPEATSSSKSQTAKNNNKAAAAARKA